MTKFDKLNIPFCLAALILSVLALTGCANTTDSRLQSHAAPAVTIDAAKRPEVALAALSLLESRYQFGGATPSTGFDCSGLVAYVVEQVANVKLPRSSAQMAQVSRPVNRHQLSTGDLVFFNTLGRPHSHVGIYLGDGRFVNAPSSGGRVRIDDLDNPYFSRRFEGGRTLFAR